MRQRPDLGCGERRGEAVRREGVLVGGRDADRVGDGALRPREVVGVALDGVRPRVESGPRVDLRAGEPVERAVVGRRRLVLERDEVVAVRRVERHGGLREDRGTGGGSPGDDERHGERAGREGTCRAKPGPPAGRERVSVAGHGCSLLSPTAAGSWIRGARGAQDGTGRSRGVTSSRRWAEP